MSRQESDKYVVRLPQGMRDAIKEAAAKERRSMNSEIIYQLSRAYGAEQTQKADATAS